MKVFKIPVDMALPIVSMDAPDDDAGFANWCREQVGGYLEIGAIRGLQRQPHLMWYDEEAKIKRRLVNERATAISLVKGYDYILGDVIVTGSKPPKVIGVDFDLGTFQVWVEGMMGVQPRRILP